MNIERSRHLASNPKKLVSDVFVRDNPRQLGDLQKRVIGDQIPFKRDQAAGQPDNVLQVLMEIRQQDRERRQRTSPESPEQQRFVKRWLL